MSRKNTRNVLYLMERDGHLVIDGTAAVQVEGYEAADTAVIPQMHVVDRERVERRRRSDLLRKACLFMAIATVVIAGSLSILWYIAIQTTLTQTAREVGTLASSYASLVTSNDARLAEIENAVDLDAVYTRAVTELHMGYAHRGQIVDYEPAIRDGVTQVQVLGDGR